VTIDNRTRKSPTGFWLSPFLQTGVVWATREGTQQADFTAAVGLSAGWTFALGERVLLGLGVGVQYHCATFGGDVEGPGFERFSPHVELNLGVRRGGSLHGDGLGEVARLVDVGAAQVGDVVREQRPGRPLPVRSSTTARGAAQLDRTRLPATHRASSRSSSARARW
jgi:hypothetical protein